MGFVGITHFYKGGVSFLDVCISRCIYEFSLAQRSFDSMPNRQVHFNVKLHFSMWLQSLFSILFCYISHDMHAIYFYPIFLHDSGQGYVYVPSHMRTGENSSKCPVHLHQNILIVTWICCILSHKFGILLISSFTACKLLIDSSLSNRISMYIYIIVWN